MEKRHALLLLLVVSSAYVAKGRPQPSDSSATGPSTPPGKVHSPRGGKAPVRFDFKAAGGAMRVLGRQQLAQISSGIRYQGDLTTLASHLDDDDDLGIEAASNRLVFQCSGLIANATAEELAATEAVANQVTAAVAGRRPQLPIPSLGQPQAFPAALVAGTPDPSGLTAAEAFSLSSRPGSKFKLVLDFDGNTLVCGTWNEAKGLKEIVTPPYDKDGNPNAFNPDEIADIVAIWHAVAEDYAAFDVDITTADPGDAALAGVGQKVLIGGHSGDWYGSAGGVAYVSSFGRPGMPCFVFPRNLGPNNAKFVWEAVSHELGHTLGLLHDGLKPNPEPGALYPDGTGYYAGHGSWAPIMGVGYYKDITQFDAGEYPFSNNPQNDMNIISRTLPRLPQKFGSALSSATPLVSGTITATAFGTGSATATANGILSVTNQADWFSFSAAAGYAKVAVVVTAPFGQGRVTRANLNAVATVFDVNGAVVTSFNPAGLDVPESQITLLSSGTYYVSVSGVGEGSPTTGGYSSYASLGFYSLTVTYLATPDKMQPVDCIGSWSDHSACDVSCNQVSTYVITQAAANGGAECPTAAGATRNLTCSDGACVKPAVDCVGAWSDWSECGIQCSQTSNFVITQPAANGGAECAVQNGWLRRQACQGGACKPPAPADTGMFVAGIKVSRELVTSPASGNRTGGRAAPQSREMFWCKAIVTVRTTAGVPLPKARVSGTWSVPGNAAFTAAAAPLDARASGQVVFRSKTTRVQGTGTSCVFTVDNAEFVGRALDVSKSVATSSYSWK